MISDYLGLCYQRDLPTAIGNMGIAGDWTEFFETNSIYCSSELIPDQVVQTYFILFFML